MNPQSVQDLINAGFYGYQGWGNAEALADYKATGGAGKGQATGAMTQTNTQAAPTNYNSSAISTANQGLQQYQPYLDKAAGFINQGISKVQDSYQGLLDSIKKRTETGVAQEFGKRGIPISSGIVQNAQNEAVTNAQAPIVANQAKDLNTGYENLASLYGGAGDLFARLFGAQSTANAASQDTYDPESEHNASQGGAPMTQQTSGGVSAPGGGVRFSDGTPYRPLGVANNAGPINVAPQPSYVNGLLMNPTQGATQLQNLRAQPTTSTSGGANSAQNFWNLLSQGGQSGLNTLGLNFGNSLYNLYPSAINTASKYLP